MKRFFILLMLMSFLLISCVNTPASNTEATVQAAQPTETLAPKPTDTPEAANTPTPGPTDTPSRIPESTATATTPPTVTPTPTATLTSTPTVTPEPTYTPTPKPTPTQTSIPWQSYRMTVTVRIGDVGALWMPVPRVWDEVGMKDVEIVEISPPPDDLYEESQGNMIAFWEVGNRDTNDYSVRFTVAVAPLKYTIDPTNIGEYDKSSPEYQRYTRPSSRIESDNQSIIQMAKQIVGSETNPYQQAKLVHQWISTNIAGPGEDGETALSTLGKRQGGCSGHSFLFIALLRSLGIPARDVGGLHTRYQGSFNNGSFWEHSLYTHVWSEFYLPHYGWIQSDTSGGPQNFAEINEPRIILSRGEDITLGHDYPLGTIPWFHIPHTDLLTNSDPKTQNPGDALVLTVERLQ